MAGKLIVDTIDTDNSFITLNVQQSLIATMNVSGIYSNTGVKMIGANGTVSNTAITGNIISSQITSIANTQITGNIAATTATTATTSTNLAGGGANTVVYQSAAGTTAYLTNGTTGQFLAATTSGAPSWGTPSANVGDHEVVVHTGNGTGSTNYNNRRFTTTMTNVGTAITYADSASLGSKFTINETGLYAIHFSDAYSEIGISLNYLDVTNPTAIPVANRLAITYSVSGSPGLLAVRTVRLVATDIIRPVSQGSITTSLALFAIRKVGV